MIKKKVDQIKLVLQKYEEARNNDWVLFRRYLEEFHPQLIDNGWINLNNAHKLPPFDTISRARRIVQNELKMYLPTDPRVARARRIKEDQMRDEAREMKLELTK